MRTRPPVALWLRRVGLVILTVIVLEYAALHLLPGARESWSSVGRAAPVVLLLSLLAELASLASYSGLTRALLPVPTRPPYATVLAVDLTGCGASHLLPGGGASGAAVRIQLLGRLGVPRADALAATGVEYAVADLWLVVALLVGLVVSVPPPGTGPIIRSAVVVSMVVLMAAGSLIAVLMQRPDRVTSAAEFLARRIPGIGPHTVERVVRGLLDQVHLGIGNPAVTRRAVLAGLGYWALDATSLYLAVLAFGVTPNPGGVLTTYALASLAALLPITPGGLGIVEGIAVPALVSFGPPNGAALLGVLAWRLFQFWLPIPIALATYLWLRRRAPSPAPRTPDPGRSGRAPLQQSRARSHPGSNSGRGGTP